MRRDVRLSTLLAAVPKVNSLWSLLAWSTIVALCYLERGWSAWRKSRR